VALTSLRATTLRSLALAATGALALFGSMALGGARNDLLRGIGTVARQFSADADVWVISPHDNQATVPFSAGRYAQRVASLPQVASVSAYAGAFLNWGDRRPWVIARPSGSSPEILHGQTISGQPGLASARLDAGGWIVISQQIAEEHHVGVGGTVSMPTPTGSARMRIAATSTNFGWPTGVIFMNTSDFRRLWASRAPTALGVDLRPGADRASARPAIERELGAANGLEVISARTRASRIEASAGEGLGQLGEIAVLLLAATVIAMVAALGSSIWQQRSTLAALRIEGAPSARLRRVLMVEALLLLSAGCVTGALAGVYGQVIIDGFLGHVAGFPVASLIATARPLEIFAAVVLTVLAIAAVPGWLASRVPPMLAFDDE
jgi:putative ABC transport system permease protein